jgi:peptidoglycan glycosyltransferase
MEVMSERKRRIEYVGLALLVAFFLVAATLIYWSVFRGTALAQREDNPRVVEEELRIQRGSILDSNDTMLAETVGSETNPERLYPIPSIGPAVGYYSFRHGTAGVEEGYDAILRGEGESFWPTFWRRNLHLAQSGQDIRLTLDSEWQRAADAILGDRAGAVILLTLPDAAVRAMVSHPGYDPNLLDEQFAALVDDADAPLLNRAAQGLYQPGLVLQPFFIAAGAERGWLTLDDVIVDPDSPVVVDGEVRRCLSHPEETATWSEVLQLACPGPMADLQAVVSPGALEDVYAAFGLTRAPELPLTTAAAPDDGVADVELALLGQDRLTVTPLQVMLAWAALANEGAIPQPQLLAAVQATDGEWTVPEVEAGAPRVATSSAAAAAVLGALPRYEGIYVEHATLVLSGPGPTMNAWYLGLAPAGEPRYAVVIVLENEDDLFAAQQAGRALLNTVLAPE